MAACYFMGSNSGIGKKSGNWFGAFRIMHQDGFGQWCIDSFWFPDKETFDLACMEVKGAGDPIIVGTDLNGKVQNVQFREDVPRLEIPAN